jgi:peroxiredoxin
VRGVRALAAAAVVALAAVLGWRLTHQPQHVEAGKVVPAPSFTLSSVAGDGEVSLASLAGRARVVNFWASDCIPCKNEMPRLQAASERWSQKGVAVIGVDVLDSRSAARAFLSRRAVTYANGFDRLGDIATRYGVVGTPTTFFIDRRGRIVKRILGPVTPDELDAEIGRALRS